MTKESKHLDFIQGVVYHLASAPYLDEGMEYPTFPPLLLVSVQADSFELGLVSLFPVLAYWGLDGSSCSRHRASGSCSTAHASRTSMPPTYRWIS